ncbi:single-stranded-DNA-specific exonuclease RecJ [Candidatus Saccharibacteria bacterium]|nr:single-stranded-DNA-specific exonuclease RecJ [Candidatus Saccharibacteria bacterium]
MNKLFTQLLEIRHFDENFLHPKYENLISPAVLNDMKKAVSRIKSAIENQEKVLIYGDYDVDGVTSSTLMSEALTLSGLPPENIEIMLPDRFKDGYGLSPRLIDHAVKTGKSLVITVDCGSRNHDIVKSLNQNHIDTIITDHHECEDTLPDAMAIINPKRHDYAGPATLKDLAGVGVAFKLAEALKDAGLIKPGQEKWLLDLVLLGTICDQMTLTGENRILCFYGTKVLEKTRRPGLRELMRVAGVRNINSEAIGFQLGPRLNAAGRLESANLSLDLLRAESSAEAASLAMRLEELNSRRRKEQTAATADLATRSLASTPVIVEAGDWHEGILGIIAGRLVEDYHKPAFVLAKTEDGFYKGSGRSFGDFSLAEALSAVKDTILGGGGHAAAAGVKVAAENLDDFKTRINEYYQSLHLPDQSKYLKTHADLTIDNLKDFTLDLLEDLKLLEPFGPGNEEPVFCLRHADILESTRMGAGKNHLRLDLRDTNKKTIKSVAFFAPKDWFIIDPDSPHDFLLKPIENEWNGTRSLEARLIDII